MVDRQHHVATVLQKRRSLIESGHNRAFRLYKRPVDDDERVVVNPPLIAMDVGTATTWPAALLAKPRIVGQLWVTDRRMVVAHRSTVTESWPWSSLDMVHILPAAQGVVGFVGDDAIVLRQGGRDSPAFSTPRTPWYRYLTIEAVFAWSRGRLDDWYAELPARLVDPQRITSPTWDQSPGGTPT